MPANLRAYAVEQQGGIDCKKNKNRTNLNHLRLKKEFILKGRL